MPHSNNSLSLSPESYSKWSPNFSKPYYCSMLCRRPPEVFCFAALWFHTCFCIYFFFLSLLCIMIIYTRKYVHVNMYVSIFLNLFVQIYVYITCISPDVTLNGSLSCICETCNMNSVSPSQCEGVLGYTHRPLQVAIKSRYTNTNILDFWDIQHWQAVLLHIGKFCNAAQRFALQHSMWSRYIDHHDP